MTNSIISLAFLSVSILAFILFLYARARSNAFLCLSGFLVFWAFSFGIYLKRDLKYTDPNVFVVQSIEEMKVGEDVLRFRVDGELTLQHGKIGDPKPTKETIEEYVGRDVLYMLERILKDSPNESLLTFKGPTTLLFSSGKELRGWSLGSSVQRRKEDVPLFTGEVTLTVLSRIVHPPEELAGKF